MNTFTPTGGLPSMSTEGAEMHDDPRLVVGGAPSVEAAVLLERLERTGEPLLGRTRRLNIVMRVEEDRRASRAGPGICPNTAGWAPGCSSNWTSWQPGRSEQVGDVLGRASHRLRWIAGGADRRNPDEVGQGRLQLRERVSDTRFRRSSCIGRG